MPHLARRPRPSLRRAPTCRCACLALLFCSLLLPRALAAEQPPPQPESPRTHPHSPPKHPTQRPALADRTTFSSSFNAIPAAATLLILATGGGLYLARRFTPRSAHRPQPLRILQRLHLSPRHSLAIVHIAGREWVLGLGPAGPPTLLGTLDGEPVPTPQPPAQPAPDRPAWLHPILMGGTLPR